MIENIISNEDMKLASKIKFVCDYITERATEKGDISQFNEDVMYIINGLLEKQVNPNALTVCENLMKKESFILHKLKEEKLKAITQLYNSYEVPDEKSRIVIADTKYFANGYFKKNFIEKEIIKEKINNKIIALKNSHIDNILKCEFKRLKNELLEEEGGE